MATLKSNKKAVSWIAGALIFSGRPDPTWHVEEATAKRLEDIWNALKPSTENLPSAPPLGYRGCWLRDASGREWVTFKGFITQKRAGTSETRANKERSFEKLLLASAPVGMIPASFEV